MSKFKKIIFLDEENTRLSQFAGEIFRRKVKGYKSLQLEIASRGNVVFFPEPVNQKLREAAGRFELDLGGCRAAQVEVADFSADTLVLTMDTDSKTKVYHNFTQAANVYTLKEYLGETGDLKLPLGGTVDEYAVVCEAVDRLLDALLARLLGEGK